MIGRIVVNDELYELNEANGRRFHEAFTNEQLVVFPKFFKPEAFQFLTVEVTRMEQTRNRRDLFMPGSENTPRKMSTLGGTHIAQMSSLIPMLYGDEELLDFISGVAGERAFPAPDLVENYVCNFLHEVGDVHGGHVDIYPFAFLIMVEAPPQDAGGHLTMVKGSTTIQDLDDEQKVKRVYVPTGDVYLLRADQAAHRVSPLTKSGRRTVINFAYANEATLNLESYSSSVLYGES